MKEAFTIECRYKGEAPETPNWPAGVKQTVNWRWQCSLPPESGNIPCRVGGAMQLYFSQEYQTPSVPGPGDEQWGKSWPRSERLQLNCGCQLQDTHGSSPAAHRDKVGFRFKSL